ncbi:MAG: hypothetical protein SNJ61_03960 [Fimbriimonadaceae bacterium]
MSHKLETETTSPKATPASGGTWAWLALGAALGAGAAAWMLQKRAALERADRPVAELLDQCDQAARLLDARVSSNALRLGA